MATTYQPPSLCLALCVCASVGLSLLLFFRPCLPLLFSHLKQALLLPKMHLDPTGHAPELVLIQYGGHTTYIWATFICAYGHTVPEP